MLCSLCHVPTVVSEKFCSIQSITKSLLDPVDHKKPARSSQSQKACLIQGQVAYYSLSSVVVFPSSWPQDGLHYLGTEYQFLSQLPAMQARQINSCCVLCASLPFFSLDQMCRNNLFFFSVPTITLYQTEKTFRGFEMSATTSTQTACRTRSRSVPLLTQPKQTSAVHVTATYRSQQRHTTSEETKMYVPQVEFMYLVFTCMPGVSYRM